jgi:hypothetical protein
MLDLMYHLPSNKRVRDLEITEDMVEPRDLSLCCWRRRDKPLRGLIGPGPIQARLFVCQPVLEGRGNRT